METEWIDAKESKPESGKAIILLCGDKYKWQCVGVYTTGWDIEVDDEDGDGDFNCDEVNCKLFLKEGWYQECEQSMSAYDSIWFHRNVSHWHPLLPLPEPPHP
jgi:hypothetical protein